MFDQGDLISKVREAKREMRSQRIALQCRVKVQKVIAEPTSSTANGLISENPMFNGIDMIL